MIKLLIPTKPDDKHAIFVLLALEAFGHHAKLWYTADFPSLQTHSFEFANNHSNWKFKDHDELVEDHFNIVWFRRPAKPILPDILHKDDVKNAQKELNMFFHSIWQMVLKNAIWINPLQSIPKVNSKLLQLKTAASIGLKIPHTIVSNDFDEISQFIKYHKGDVIYKTLHPLAWFDQKTICLMYTKKISVEDLPSKDILQCTPGIYQKMINKKYELRITYFGDQYVAVKIYSQQHVEAIVDWRSAPTRELDLEETRLPENIHLLCKKFMKELGVIFGCFDFIVTEDHEYYLL